MIVTAIQQFFCIIVPTVYHRVSAVLYNTLHRTQNTPEAALPDYIILPPHDFDVVVHARAFHGLPDSTVIFYEPPPGIVPPGTQYRDHTGASYILCLAYLYSVTRQGQPVLGD